MSALPPDFTHLHVHSHYSLLGGTASPAALAARARADGRPSLALADSNALFGAVAFARACRAEGIRPIIGMAVSMAPPPEEMAPGGDAGLGRLVLLAADPAGYRSLCRLSSLYQSDPDRERRRRQGFAWDELKAHAGGLFGITGGRTDWLERFLRAGNRAAATRYVSRLGGLFGERCCLAVSPDLTGDLALLAGEIVALARRFGARAVAAQPIFCLEAEERPLLRLMAAIDGNCSPGEVADGALPDGGDEASAVEWPDPVAFAELYQARPELLAAAGEVAAACGEALPDGRPLWPSLGLESPAETLRRQAVEGMLARYGYPVPGPVIGRLNREMEVIAEGFAPLFLVVADVVRFAREAGIPVSTRGSVANSLAAYCLGITSVDPVIHDLLFERFLNPARRNLPDIDLDFCSRRRDEVLDYVRRTYGADRVALISTMNTMRSRSAVRETGKAYGLSEEAIAALAARMPESWHPDPRRRTRETMDDVLAKVADPLEREVIRLAYRLVGQPHHAGLHPGGLVIAPGPMTDTAPVLLSPKGFLAVQYEHGDVEAIGLPKLDLLGIRALTVLADAMEMVKRRSSDLTGRRGPTHADGTSPADLSGLIVRENRLPDEARLALQGGLKAIPDGDPMTAAILSAGETIGVFQCESDGARRTLRQLRARNVADLAVAGAFFKPGPATGGMARAFVRRYRGEERVTYLHPALEPILSRTKGVLLFQEQVLRVAVEIAGLSWGQADQLRRGMSKFKAAEMDALAAAFADGCCRAAPDGPGFTREEATKLWEQVMAFAGYGFNQGHATAYADVSYRSAFMKAHWPAEFMAARLADAGGFHHPAIYMAEAARLGIAVRPPHVNYSEESFTLTYEAGPDGARPVLWMGLGQVRDLRRATAAAIIAGRAAGPFADPADLLGRVRMQPKEMDNLVRCGALDGLGASRAAMLAEGQTAGRAGGGRQLSFGFLDAPDIPADSVAERLAWETEVLGQPVSAHPLEVARRERGDRFLRELPATRGTPVTTLAARLPGWPGGPGFFIGDGETFHVARPDKALEARKIRWPKWRPLRLGGRWLVDEWGGGWFEVTSYELRDTKYE